MMQQQQEEARHRQLQALYEGDLEEPNVSNLVHLNFNGITYINNFHEGEDAEEFMVNPGDQPVVPGFYLIHTQTIERTDGNKYIHKLGFSKNVAKRVAQYETSLWNPKVLCVVTMPGTPESTLKDLETSILKELSNFTQLHPDNHTPRGPKKRPRKHLFAYKDVLPTAFLGLLYLLATNQLKEFPSAEDVDV